MLGTITAANLPYNGSYLHFLIKSLRHPAVDLGKLIPPITIHPSIKISNFHRRTSKHDEVGNASRSPVVKVVEAKGVTHLVQENVDTARVDIVHEVLTTNLLAPAVTIPALKAISKPQRVVKVAISTTRALAVVAIQVSFAVATNIALRDAISILVGVNVDAIGGTLEQALILDGPTNNIDVDFCVGKAVVAVHPLEPLLVLGIVGAGDLLTLSLGDLGGRIPSYTDVKGTKRFVELARTFFILIAMNSPIVAHDLVPAPVLVTLDTTIVRLLSVLPDFL